VSKIKKGERVVACFDISCGECDSCSKVLSPLHAALLGWQRPRLAGWQGLFTLCDKTNNSEAQEALYGDRSGGFFGLLPRPRSNVPAMRQPNRLGLSGYTHMTGGWDGGQAEYVRVPYGKVAPRRSPLRCSAGR
jgi:threonine dehydrogenase-like Zn-dependent dehydrogenase